MTTDAEVMSCIVRNACFSADSVAIGGDFQLKTRAEQTRLIIERALEALEANGIIKIMPVDEWAYYYIPDPPYKSPFLINSSERG